MIETELPEDYLALDHQRNLQFLRNIQSFDVINVLETVNYCLQSIPLTLYDKIFELEHDVVMNTFSEGHWVRSEVCLMIKCWQSNEWCMKAAEFGKMDWILYAKKNCIPLDISVFKKALLHGHFEIIQYLRKQNPKYYCLNEEVFETAVRSNKLDIVKWMKDQNCPWNSEVFNSAIRIQNFEIIKWLKKEGCPWNNSTFMISCIHHEIITANVGIKIVKWLHQQGCPNASYGLRYFVKNGNVEMVIYLHEQFPNLLRNSLFDEAVYIGKINIMQWCKEVHHPSFILKQKHCTISTRLGKLNNLKWLKENKCPWAKKMCHDIATKKGYLLIAEWISQFKSKKKH